MRNFLRSALLAVAAVWSDARAASPAESRLLLCYDLPAQDGEEALPVGNDRRELDLDNVVTRPRASRFHPTKGSP